MLGRGVTIVRRDRFGGSGSPRPSSHLSATDSESIPGSNSGQIGSGNLSLRSQEGGGFAAAGHPPPASGPAGGPGKKITTRRREMFTRPACPKGRSPLVGRFRAATLSDRLTLHSVPKEEGVAARTIWRRASSGPARSSVAKAGRAHRGWHERAPGDRTGHGRYAHSFRRTCDGTVGRFGRYRSVERSKLSNAPAGSRQYRTVKFCPNWS